MAAILVCAFGEYMSPLLLFSVIVTVLALGFYTSAVWWVWGKRTIHRGHLAFYWLGFACDLAGTIGMSLIAGRFEWNAHGITGALALGLMAINAVWVTILHRTPDKDKFNAYRKISLAIWGVWLVSFLTGMMLSMTR